MPAPRPNPFAAAPAALARAGVLLAEELQDSAARWQRRLLWQAAAAGCALLALGLAGVGAMLVSVAPAATPPTLWAVPGAAALLAVFCLLAAGPAPPPPRFSALREAWPEASSDAAPAPPSTAESTSVPGAAFALLSATGREALRPVAQRHPLALVGGAAAAGALLVWARPWRAAGALDWSRLAGSLGTQFGTRWVEQHGAELASELMAALLAGQGADAVPSYNAARPATTAAGRPAA